MRPYQLAAIEAARKAYREGHRRVLISLATGTGKTVIFSEATRLALSQGGQVLILAHRQELIHQAADKLARHGVRAAIEMGDRDAMADAAVLFGEGTPSVVVASVQTLHKKRLRKWSPGFFSLIVVDEAHHAVAQSYTRILKHFDKARVLGVTATVDRADDEDLGQVFSTIAYEYSIRQAVADKYLAPIRAVRVDAGVDLRDLSTRGKRDWSDDQLADLIRPHVETLANAAADELGGRRFIVFTPDVASAQGFATALTSLGLRCDSVSYQDPDARRRAIAAFTQGEIQGLVNCAILTEGFDEPSIDAVVIARPTKSRALYCQMVGRGTRLFLGKSECKLIDFSWGAEEHDLCQAAHLYATPGDLADDPEILTLANAMIAKSKGEVSLEDAIEECSAEVRAKRQEEAARAEKRRIEIEAQRRKVKARRKEFDPLGISEAFGVRPLPPWSDRSEPITDKQRSFLEKVKWPGIDRLSKKQAGEVIGTLMNRIDRGLATPGQVKLLAKKGFDVGEVANWTVHQASEAIDSILNRRAS